MFPTNAYTIRQATEKDAAALELVAQLDGQRPLTGRVLLAEADGTIVAALSIDEGRSVADPFRPGAAALAILRTRVGMILAEERQPDLRERIRDALAVGRRPASGLA
jgi:hypothetical protein